MDTIKFPLKVLFANGEVSDTLISGKEALAIELFVDDLKIYIGLRDFSKQNLETVRWMCEIYDEMRFFGYFPSTVEVRVWQVMRLQINQTIAMLNEQGLMANPITGENLWGENGNPSFATVVDMATGNESQQYKDYLAFGRCAFAVGPKYSYKKPADFESKLIHYVLDSRK